MPEEFPREYTDISILDEDGSTNYKTFTRYSSDILPRIYTA